LRSNLEAPWGAEKRQPAKADQPKDSADLVFTKKRRRSK
jgi:hypothetical protein